MKVTVLKLIGQELESNFWSEGLDYVRIVGTEEEERARLVRLEEKHKRGERNRELQAVRFKLNIMWIKSEVERWNIL